MPHMQYVVMITVVVLNHIIMLHLFSVPIHMKYQYLLQLDYCSLQLLLGGQESAWLDLHTWLNNTKQSGIITYAAKSYTKDYAETATPSSSYAHDHPGPVCVCT